VDNGKWSDSFLIFSLLFILLHRFNIISSLLIYRRALSRKYTPAHALVFAPKLADSRDTQTPAADRRPVKLYTHTHTHIHTQVDSIIY